MCLFRIPLKLLVAWNVMMLSMMCLPLSQRNKIPPVEDCYGVNWKKLLKKGGWRTSRLLVTYPNTLQILTLVPNYL